jgi:hypothetical protein
MATKIEQVPAADLRELLARRAKSISVAQSINSSTVNAAEPDTLFIAYDTAATGARSGRTEKVIELVNTLVILCKANRRAEAIDTAIAYFDDRLTDNELEDANLALYVLNPQYLASSVVVSILGITRKAAHLPTRRRFFERAYEVITKAKGRKYAKELLEKYR